MRFKSKLLASAVALSTMLAAGAEAATPPSLDTYVLGGLRRETTAKFAGGATLNGGASFQSTAASTLGFENTVPADVPISLSGSVTVDPADVGQEGDLFMVVEALGKLYMLTTSGFQVWNFNGVDAGGLLPFATKTLGSTESYNLTDLETRLGQSLDGQRVLVYFGYMSDTSKLNYSTPFRFRVNNLPEARCPTDGGVGIANSKGPKRLCVLRGTYTRDLHLTNNFEYIVTGPVFFGGDNANSIKVIFDPGVKTYGESGADFMRVSRGSQVFINGTRELPVVMTGAAEDTANENTTGLWGGFVVNGNAPINGCSVGTVLCQAAAEGNAGNYGGNNPTESSGAITYLQILYAGFEISPGNELNALTLNGVGSGTVVDYVHTHNGSDDGVETFGGRVNLKHLVMTGIDDDSLDWQIGWQGKAQHVLVIQKPVGDRGIEADNNAAARDSQPRAKGQVANFTFIGRATNNVGIKLREGTAANLYNGVVKGYGAGCIDIDHGPTFLVGGSSATNLTGELTIINSLFDCTVIAQDAASDNWSTVAWFQNQAGNLSGPSNMTGYINSATVNARPAAQLPSDGFFDQVDYIGAVKDTANDWTLGWTFRQPFEKLLP